MDPYALDISSDSESIYIGLFIDGYCVAFAEEPEVLLDFVAAKYPTASYALTQLHADHPNGVTEIAELPDIDEQPLQRLL